MDERIETDFPNKLHHPKNMYHFTQRMDESRVITLLSSVKPVKSVVSSADSKIIGVVNRLVPFVMDFADSKESVQTNTH